MRSFPVFLLAALALAGCLSSEPTAPENPAPTSAPGLPEAGRPIYVMDGNQNPLELGAFEGEAPVFEQLHVSTRRSGEPTIGITRSHAVFYPSIEFDVGAPGATTLPSTIYYRSVDGGQTWEDVSPQIAGVKTHQTSFDPYVYVDPTTSRVFAMDMGPHVACNKVSWSDNNGLTWATRDGACPTPVADHPTLFAGPRLAELDGLPGPYPNNVYLCSNQVADVQCSVSPDGGLNWLPSQPVFVGVDTEELDDPFSLNWLCGSLTGHGHASFVDGTVYLGRGYCGAPVVGISRDGGLNWETSIISGNATHYLAYQHDVSVGTDAAGNAYAFWHGNGDTTAYLSISRDQGRTWSEPLNVTAPGVTAVKLPSLVAGANGTIAFQYIGTTTPSGWGIHTRADEPGMEDERRNATWHAYVGMSINALDEQPVFVTTTVNDVAQPLKRGDCWDRCFGNEGGMYDFLDIDIDPITGQIWTALVDVCTNECDAEGADADSYQRAFGAVGKQVAGTKLLLEPIPAR